MKNAGLEFSGVLVKEDFLFSLGTINFEIITLSLFGFVFIMSSTMPIWTTYIPHHLAPRNSLWLFSIKFSKIWTPVISSFAFHHVHHNHPKVPTALLPKVSKEEDEIFDQLYINHILQFQLFPSLHSYREIF